MIKFWQEKAFWHNHLPSSIAALVAGGTFVWNYAVYPGVPGNNPDYPLGWWGWSDQGRYWIASQNDWSMAIKAADQTYPPLYPAIGAVFLPLSKMHSYLPVDLSLFMVYVLAFVETFGPLIGRWLALAALCLGLFQYNMLSLQWVIPWTSSLSAALGMLSLLMLQRFIARRRDAAWSLRGRVVNGALCGLAVGLIAPTRPGDFIAFTPVLLAYGVWVLRDYVADPARTGLGGLNVLFAGVIAAGLPPACYLLFNAVLFGHPLGGYFTLAQNNGGFVPGNLIERAYSHVFDAATYYADPSADWMSRVPVLAVALCFTPMIILFGPMLLRISGLVVLLNMFLVYSYADAVPTGQFHYFNIHYFKWLYPVLIVFVLYFIRFAVITEGKSRGGHLAAISASLAILCLIVSLRPVYQKQLPVRVTVDGPHTLSLDFSRAVQTDFIDIRGLNATVGQYDIHAQGLWIAGCDALRPQRDFRVTPRPGGIRFLLNGSKWIKSATLNVSGVGDLEKVSQLQVMAVAIRFGLASPYTSTVAAPQFPALPVSLGKMYTVDVNGEGNNYLAEGWSNPESWGRWIDGKSATVSFKLPPGMPNTVRFELYGQGFVVQPEQSTVVVDILAKGALLQTLELKDPHAHSFVVVLPESSREPDGTVVLTLRPHSTLSPSQIGMNPDSRRLSFGFIKFRVSYDAGH